jgi:hypothetical protein
MRALLNVIMENNTEIGNECESLNLTRAELLLGQLMLPNVKTVLLKPVCFITRLNYKNS